MHPAQCPVTEARGVLEGDDLTARWCPRCDDTHDVLHCPKCGRDMEPEDLAEFVGIPPERADEDSPAPTLPPDLMAVYMLHGQLSIDGGGAPSVVERDRLLTLMGVDDPAERDVWWELWDRITLAKATEDRRHHDALTDRSGTSGTGGISGGTRG